MPCEPWKLLVLNLHDQEEKTFKKFAESLLTRASKVSELQSTVDSYKEATNDNEKKKIEKLCPCS